MQKSEKNNRRRFLKSMLIAGTTVGIGAPLALNQEQTDTSQVQMLTPDGRLVLVNKSVLKKTEDQKKATEREVFEWMNEKHKT